MGASAGVGASAEDHSGHETLPQQRGSLEARRTLDQSGEIDGYDKHGDQTGGGTQRPGGGCCQPISRALPLALMRRSREQLGGTAEYYRQAMRFSSAVDLELNALSALSDESYFRAGVVFVGYPCPGTSGVVGG